MVFSSLTFLYGFLPLILLCWFVAPKSMRNWVLLLGSLFFYAFGQPTFVLLLLFASFSNWGFALLLSQSRNNKRARAVLIASICVNLLLLGFFKYADFLIGSVNQLFGKAIPLLHVPLPIGISFFIFQSMSYVIDVYREEVKPQRSLGQFSTYVALFPQLIAGPVVRYREVEEGLQERSSSVVELYLGIRRFTIGLAKKVLIANSMDELCSVFRGANEQSVLFFWIYALAFTLQIYFDFSGYSDMAIGIGQMLGFRFPENFRYPYCSRSITEFWRRWHITLGSWFRDYVYIPLGGNRKGKILWLRNLAIVWLLTGLWHGAAWNFALWGLLYGFLLMIEKLFLGRCLERWKILSHIYVLFFVVVGFVMFNADGVGGMIQDLSSLFGGSGLPLWSVETSYYLKSYLLTLLIAITGVTPLPKLLVKRWEEKSVMRVLEPLTIGLLLLGSTAFLVDGSFNPFLYFRF